MRHTILFTFALTAATALLAFGGCSKSSPSGSGYGGGGGGGGGGTGNQVTISNFAFNSLTVAKGTTVTWKNNDNTWHTATADSGSFDSGTINANTTSAGVTLNQSGTFAYHCNHHSSMHGTVIVQ